MSQTQFILLSLFANYMVERRSKLFTIVVIAGALVHCACVAQDGGLQDSDQCEQYYAEQVGEYTYHNDVYGATVGADFQHNYKLCSRLGGLVSQPSFRIDWSFKKRSFGIKAYPHVSAGWDWQKALTWPASLGRLESENLNAAYSYTISTNAPYNVSFDLWLSKNGIRRPNYISSELMIWVRHGGIEKILGNRYESVKIDGYRYHLYRRLDEKKAGKWKYFAFVAQDELPSSWEINVGHFISHLRQLGFVADEEMLIGISFGAEITSGNGHFEVSKFILKESVSTE